MTKKLVAPAILIIGLLSIWELSSLVGIMSSPLFPRPSAIISAIGQIPELGSHVATSVSILFLSIVIGFPIGFLVGLAMGLKVRWAIVEDILSFFMAIPGISWAPLFVMTIGFGSQTVLLVGVLTAFFPAVYAVYHGARDIDPNYRRLGRLLEYSNTEKLFHISVPAVMNYVIGALKLSFARTWRTVIAVEMIAATSYGLGYMTIDARELLNSRRMFAGILLSGLTYVFIEMVLVRALENVTVRRWGMRTAT